MKTDQEIISDIREDLYYGSVSLALERLNDIKDYTLKREMADVIQEYQGKSIDYY